jgi:acyl carrier protein
MSDGVQPKVFSIIAREAAIHEDGIEPDATLKDLGIGSLDRAQIVFAIEDHFRIQIPDRDPDFDTRSVSGLVDAVEKLLAEHAAHPSASS